ncbi:MAG: CotH kinase family protein [Oscillospiraceae bacterium]|nr:CotH kinase family protein [Oscillospiraceae bacterium]
MLKQTFNRKSFKITIIVFLTAMAAAVMYALLHYRHTGVLFPVSDYIILPMRHWVVLSAAVLFGAASLYLLMFQRRTLEVMWLHARRISIFIWCAIWPLFAGKGKFAVVTVSFAVLITASFLLSANPITIVFPEGTHENTAVVGAGDNRFTDLTLSFSEIDHFQRGGIVVEITASEPNAVIFYTTDGSVPTIYCAQYSEPIYFGVKSELYAVVLRAIAAYGDYFTEPLTHTYFIGEEIHERFGEDILVFSLSTDPEYLFDHDIGILVPGRIREDWLLENPDSDIPLHGQPANYRMRGVEWERLSNVEIFTPQGARVLTQVAGLRVHGAATRVLYQRSLRLYARREYSPNAGRFHFDFFPNFHDVNGVPITRVDRLILRNGGNDFFLGMIRNELGYKLAAEAGLIASPTQAVAIFINGEYYGFAWLQIRYDSHFLQDLHGTSDRTFDIIRGGDIEAYGRLLLVNGSEEAIYDIHEVNAFSEKNMQDDLVFSTFKEKVDIDNLLLYYAFRIYWGDDDWPSSDMVRWRYSGEQPAENGSHLDGRWRHIAKDLDFGLGSSHTRDDMLHVMVMDDNPRSPLLQNILTRPDMADKFTMIMCDLAANIINGQTVSDGIDTIFTESVWSEVEHWAVYRDRDIDSIKQQHQLIINTATYRHEYIFSSLSRHFGFPLDMFDVNISGGEAVIGTQRGTSSRYFNHLVIPVSPVLPEFYEFDHWVLNGERIFDADITVSFSDINEYGSVELGLVKRFVMPPLVIAELYEIGVANGMALVNLTDEEVHTRGLFLSNDSRNLRRWALPPMTVASGESLRLAGRGSRTADQMFRVQMDFNVREGRKFWLSDIEGNIIDSFTLRGAERAVRDTVRCRVE